MEIGFATKGVIFKEGKILLIVKSNSEKMNPNTVDIPGGRLDFGEMPEESLKREIIEEVGLDVEILGILRCWSFIKKEKNFQLVGVTFLCNYRSGNVALSDEHTSFLWVEPREIIEGDYSSWLKDEVKSALRKQKSV